MSIPTNDTKFGGGKGFAPKLVGIMDAARILGIGRTKVYQLLADGDLESCHLGQRHLVRFESIERLADSLK